MKFLIVHLSDIHIKGTTDFIFQKKDKILDTYKNRLNGVSKVFILIAGDIAFSGNKDEYIAALDLLITLKSATDDILDNETSIIMVPGNHDCNYSIGNTAIRNVIIDQVLSNGLDKANSEFIQNCCEVQTDYNNFVESVHDKDNIKYNDELLKVYQYEFEGKKIQFNCYNTSWLSKKK